MEVAQDFDEFIACLTAHGVEFVIVGAYALDGPFGTTTAPFIGRETLIRNKRAAGRPKDLSDVDALERGEAP